MSENINHAIQSELIKKYKWAGKIRFISALLLFIFLFFMRATGGQPSLNRNLFFLIFVEAILNQPYGLFFKHIPLKRFLFYQVLTDTVFISWLIHYMGGIEAPVITIAYYVVILEAGLIAGSGAVFFATIASSLLFSSIVILEYLYILPPIRYLGAASTMQYLSVLGGNIAFFFAFGYFSAHSFTIIKFLERKRLEEHLKHTHKLRATGFLLGGIVHDIVNNLGSIRGYIRMFMKKIETLHIDIRGLEETKIYEHIEKLESENISLLSKLLRFSEKREELRQPYDIHEIIYEALELTQPLLRMSDAIVEEKFAKKIPAIVIDKDQLQEVFVLLFLNLLEAIAVRGKITIQTFFTPENKCAMVSLIGSGQGLKAQYLEEITRPFFYLHRIKEDTDIGLDIIREIIVRHKGELKVVRLSPTENVISISFPVS